MTRAVISLVDSDTQYILAEATQTISLMKDSRHDLGDELAFANLTLPRRDSICARVFDSTVTIPNATGQEQSIDAFVVQDALENETVKHNEMVQKQRVRFFASVPIVTLEGVKIGAYSVMSGKQRSGLTFAEYQFLQDVSSTVFEHLVLVRDRLNSVRGAKMVEGLTEFVGRSENSASVYTASESSPRGDMSEQMDHHISSSDDDKLESSIRDPLRRRRPRSIQASIPDEPQSKNSSLENSLQGNPLLVDENARISHSLNKLPTISTIETDLKRMFRQAAKALQVSTEANGCIFIEASFGDMRKDSPHVDHNRQAFDTAGRLSPRNAVFDREGKSESSLESQHETQSDSDGSKTSDANDSPRKQANVLGSSFFMRGKIQTDSGFPSFVCTEQDLQRCIHRYPRGKIFNFSGEGTISSGDDTLSDRTISTKPSKPALSGSGVSSQKRNRNQSRVRRFVAGELTKIIPDVKSVIFLPLWDFTQGRWHSGLFLWTTELGRLMDTNDEFPYIRAFGNTIMNEVSRLDAVHAERAKTTFIASISHELRSPLHGILGSTEFMLDTNLDSFQRGLIASVETCGKTLLDTIDHVLDYAKINYFGTLESQKGPTRSRRSQRSSRSQLGSVSHTNRTSTFNICILVEEVVEAVFAGQTFKDSNASTHVDVFDDHTGSSTTKTKRNDAQRSRTLNQSGRFRDGMTVVLNIDMNIDCTIISQPGALRRVVMNLFGNALKYSHAGKGLVEVTLRRSTKPARRTQGRASIEIVITDTGRGMSADYLRNKLYRPFSQEDPFSVGTGLGLSIVRQIVTSLNGNIQIESEQGKGTEITVNLDLPSIEPTEDRTQRPSISKTTRGLKICILEPGELEPSTEQARTHMVDALQGVLSTWFGMTVSTASTPEESKADFYVYPEPPSIEILLKEQDSKDKSIDQKSQRVPLIIVCTNAFEEAALKFAGLERLTTLGWRIEVISQP